MVRGQDTLDYVLRKFLPNAQGIKFAGMEAFNPLAFEFNWNITATPTPNIVQNPEFLYVVAFLQDPQNQEVIQVTRLGRESYFEPQVATSFTSKLNPYIEIYPNPASVKIWVKVTINYRGPFTLRLFNLQIQKVFECKSSINSSIWSINLPILPAGVYFVEILSHNSVLKRKKIIISAP